MTKEFYDEVVKETKEDFEERRNKRRSLELQWRLNMNYLAGNQYSEITPRGDVEERGKDYFWQEREVYNHIAPIVETRVSKLSRVKGKVRVRPLTSDVKDRNSAKLSTRILQAVEDDCGLDALVKEASLWSEVCGTVFYKVGWDRNKGKIVGRTKRQGDIREGDVTLSVVPPFEIYPDNLFASNTDECKSIIHAKSYHVDEIRETWGVDVKGETVNVFTMDTAEVLGGLGYTASIPKTVAGVADDHAIVIEKYVKPTKSCPFGRLIIVAGDKLLYYGDLPYAVGDSGARGYPFCIQRAIGQAGSLFGVSVIERVIPIQRAYNAVKNRKHEFMNRIAMGVLAVEDGSVEIEGLEEEGLAPGKILVYRQGSNPPRMLQEGSVPSDFQYEEKQLLEEFNMISGVSEVMQYSQAPTASTSGVALDLLLRQDETRLNVAAESLRDAMKEIGKRILRLYKQFATKKRLMRVAGAVGEVETVYFTRDDISSDDLVFESESELLDTPATRRSMVLELLKLGLLHDENGRLGDESRAKILEMLGLGNWEHAHDISDLHMRRAQSENIAMRGGQDVKVSDFDNHDAHIREHLSDLLSDGDSDTLTSHLREHKKHKRVQKTLEEEKDD